MQTKFERPNMLQKMSLQFGMTSHQINPST